jgi:hypothetical protein
MRSMVPECRAWRAVFADDGQPSNVKLQAPFMQCGCCACIHPVCSDAPTRKVRREGAVKLYRKGFVVEKHRQIS